MVKIIDGKFQIIAPRAENIEIVGTDSSAIPEDEPLFLFRARDRHALAVLQYYLELCRKDDCTSYQIQGIHKRIAAFVEFRRDHPERMKQPGITKGERIK